jgi:hypothetical protein
MTVVRIRIDILADDDGENRPGLFSGRSENAWADLGQVRPGAPERMVTQDRRVPMLELAALPVPEARRRWWRR